MTDTRVIAGFIPLLDCAPLVVAAEKGFAAEHGIDLTLVRETSWANIRDRIVVGHFDAAHMLGPMAVASTLGIGHLKVPLVAPYSLGFGGNAITMSNRVWEQMTAYGAVSGAEPAAQGAALAAVVRSRSQARKPALILAMVYPFSCHNYLLRYWLAACGIHPDRDVRLVVLPPPLLVDALREGQIDGFCVGEPWNSLAVAGGVGNIVTATADIWRLAPEKVIGCRLEWAQRHPKLLANLLRALHQASQWCGQSANSSELARLLAQPRYVGAPADILLRGLSNRLLLTPHGAVQNMAGFYVPATRSATLPNMAHALWFYAQMVRWGQSEFAHDLLPAVCATYRPDLYRRALDPELTPVPADRNQSPLNGFFDGRSFDPDDVRCYGTQESGQTDTRTPNP
jgi:two-component system, oxyanion-binding sensor